MYAVFLDGQKQYKAAQGDDVLIDYREAEPGTTVAFDRVLLYAGGAGPIIGSPYIPDAKVVAEVQGHEKGPKIYVQHMRRRKDSRRRTGHRQMHTRIVIHEIVIPGASGPGPADQPPDPQAGPSPAEGAAP